MSAGAAFKFCGATNFYIEKQTLSTDNLEVGFSPRLEFALELNHQQQLNALFVFIFSQGDGHRSNLG